MMATIAASIVELQATGMRFLSQGDEIAFFALA
jgi:hypothetical protein